MTTITRARSLALGAVVVVLGSSCAAAVNFIARQTLALYYRY